MSNLVTIKTFDFPTQAHVFKTRLESEGIYCELKNEFTAQVHNFYSNAIGGVQIQVYEEDVSRALQLLADAGYYTKESLGPMDYVAQFIYKVGSKIPFFKNKNGLEKFVYSIGTLLGFLALIVAVLAIVYSEKRQTYDTYEFVTGRTWCVDYMSFRNQVIVPESQFNGIKMVNDCPEVLIFRNDGSLEMPGFNTFPTQGTYDFRNNKFYIDSVSNEFTFYKGGYSVAYKDRILTLFSDSLTIVCHDDQSY